MTKYQARRVETVLFGLILILGIALRFTALPAIPADLRQGEQEHLDVAQQFIREGVNLTPEPNGVLFEPLYPALVAVMHIIVPNLELAARLVSASMGSLLLVLAYLWIRLATQNRWLALAVMAALATNFWAVMLSRSIHRAITLSVFYVAAASLMRHGIHVEEDIEDEDFLPFKYRPTAEIEGWLRFALAGVALGLSFYTHPAARLMWVVFPTFLIFLSLDQPGVIRQIWPGMGILLGVMGLIAAPIIVYMVQHPQQTFLVQMLDLYSLAQQGYIEPLRHRLRLALGVMTVTGDPGSAFNLPGKPLLGPLMSLLFYIGVSIALTSLAYPYRPSRRGVRSFDESFRVTSANAFMLLTQIVGLAAVYLTGLVHSSTQAVGQMFSIVFFPALPVQWMADSARANIGKNGPVAVWTAYGIGLIAVTGMSIHNYFTVWALQY